MRLLAYIIILIMFIRINIEVKIYVPFAVSCFVWSCIYLKSQLQVENVCKYFVLVKYYTELDNF